MKTLHKFILKSYVGPFVMTFFIAMFVFFMMFIFKYIDDFVGKGLSFSILSELFFYFSLTTIPMALPLAILLSSLMTFGNLGEHFELTAMKSSGLSLQKIMTPLILTTFCLSLGAFYHYYMLFENLSLLCYFKK
ncbi:MAG: LptF/LptG family permease [Bacteroidetes bacterium]|nr:LptF/LptG family permease [Bacteroidota bacterium]